ncbi:Zinc metalloproteinase nas-8 [Aphelenchoides besseyi]|nr:Zinc metalloproteinase nas-8 [Aphelenchoides besseyi]
MIFLLLRSCHATVQPFLTNDDFQRASSPEESTTHLTEQDFKNADKYNNMLIDKKSKRGSILSHQKFYRGDIRGRAQYISMRLNRSKLRSGVRRNGVISTIKKWPQARIPYVLSTQYNERERAVLARAFQEYHRKTCIRFAPKETFDRDYLYIGKIDGCYSDVGKAGGRQELSLDDGCMQYDTIVHELMHSIGFYHEHERWDRDHFIQILWQNIDREAYDQFGRVDLAESSYYGEGYDYHSIMHYDSMAFSKNGRETLVARQPAMTHVIGSALDFSPTDLIKIQRMYMCSVPTDSTIPITNPISPIQNFALPRIDSPWSSLGATLPISNHIIEQPTLPLPAFPRAQPETTTTTEATTSICADRSTLCWRWLDRCHSPFFEKIMREFCAQSCGFCTPQTTRTWRAYSDADHHYVVPDYTPLQQLPYYQIFG